MIAVLYAALATLGAPSLQAQTITATATRTSTAIEINASVLSLDRQRVISSVADGLEVEILFEFRLYEKTGRPFGFLGDRLVGERRVRRSGSKDLFASRFIVTEHRGRPTLFDRETDFLGSLSHLPSFRIEYGEIRAHRGLYVMVRARIHYVRLDPPLNIVNLFSPTAVTTDWTRFDIR